MTPRALLHEARALIEGPPQDLAGIWPRAAALLTRQALERVLVDAFDDPALTRVPFAVQLYWFRQRAPDKALADRLTATWSALSEACHFHDYELPPSTPALLAWIDVVERAADMMEPDHRAGGRSGP